MPVRGKSTWVAKATVPAGVSAHATLDVKTHVKATVMADAGARATAAVGVTARVTVTRHVPLQVRNPDSLSQINGQHQTNQLWIAKKYSRAASFSRAQPRRFFLLWVP